jgi:pilus assembly protein CpaB
VKNLTPAKLVMLVFVAMGAIIFLYVAKTLLAKEAPPPRIPPRMIPMATGDLMPGTVITEKHLGQGPWPASDLRDDVLLSNAGIVGRVVKEPIKAATPIHGKALYSHGQLPPLKVSDGFRAVTIRIKNGASLMEGLLRPGDHVDLIFTPAPMADDPRYAKIGGLAITLFKGVTVLAVNRDFVQNPLLAGGNSATLEIAEREVPLLLLAQEKGEIALSYTPQHGGFATVKPADPDRPTLEEILSLPPLPEPPAPPPPPPAPPEPNRNSTHIYRRSMMSVNGFVNGQPSHGASLVPWNASGQPVIPGVNAPQTSPAAVSNAGPGDQNPYAGGGPAPGAAPFTPAPAQELQGPAR